MLEAFAEKYPESYCCRSRKYRDFNRSTLATYMGIMDDIRAVFAKETGQPAGLFSFNSLGACPVCNGKGVLKPDVAFADPVTVTCEACGGTRYSDEALSYRYQGKNIVEILDLTIDEAMDYFKLPKIIKRVNNIEGCWFRLFNIRTDNEFIEWWRSSTPEARQSFTKGRTNLHLR